MTDPTPFRPSPLGLCHVHLVEHGQREPAAVLVQGTGLCEACATMPTDPPPDVAEQVFRAGRRA